MIPPNRQSAMFPSLIQQAVDRFKETHEKDIVCLSLLTAVSGLLVNVKGNYASHRMYPNLFTIIVGPPGSGKSSMLVARTCMQEIHNYIQKKSKEQALGRRGKPRLQLPSPRFILSADITSASLVRHLKANEDAHCPSLMIDSEIDTAANANSSKHGGFTPVWRKAFHNEPIDRSRATDNEAIEIREPKLAICLSGTVDQVKRLLPTHEDGLYSRFAVIYLPNYRGWISVGPTGEGVSNTHFFAHHAKEFLKFWQFTERYPMEVKLLDYQVAEIDENFRTWHAVAAVLSKSEYQSLIVRNANILFKMCMTLSALRRYEEFHDSENPSVEWECDDADFTAAWNIANQSLQDSVTLLAKLPQAKGALDAEGKKLVYNALPDTEFTTAQLKALATRVRVSDRTAERYLDEFTQIGLIEKVKHGVYRKVPIGGLAE